MSNSKKLIITVVLVCIAAFVFLNTDASQLNVSNLDQTLDLTGQAFETTCKSNADCPQGSTCEIPSRNGIGTCSLSRASFHSRIISQRNMLKERAGAKKTIAESLCLQKGCYDTDPSQDIFKSGELFFRKQKSDGEQYCQSISDSCKQFPNGKWMVTQQFCEDAVLPGQTFNDKIVKSTYEFCEGKCAYGACLPATCDDGIQNQGETEIDCGGPCDSCAQTYCEDPNGVTPLTKDGVITKDINGNDLEVPDKCLDENTLEESICENNEFGYQKVNCDNCLDGACVANWCIDPDGLDITKRTVIEGSYWQGGTSWHADYCSETPLGASSPNGKYLHEGICKGGIIDFYDDPILNQNLPLGGAGMKCPEGSWCFDGACEEVICSDTDGGDNEFKKGKIVGLSYGLFWEQEDKCYKGIDYPGWDVDDDKIYVEEWVCDHSEISLQMKNHPVECPFGCEDGACIPDPCEPVEFADQNLEQAVRNHINKPAGVICKDDVLGITHFTAFKKNIADLGGIEHLVNLQSLYIWENQISDLTPLIPLKSLRTLGLEKNQISDLTPLSTLTNLEWLYLHENQISDISALSPLTNLEWLHLYNNQISDIAPLSTLTNLEQLSFGNNQITDLAPISSLTNLEWLSIWGNPFSSNACFTIHLVTENNPGIDLECNLQGCGYCY